MNFSLTQPWIKYFKKTFDFKLLGNWFSHLSFQSLNIRSDQYQHILLRVLLCFYLALQLLLYHYKVVGMFKVLHYYHILNKMRFLLYDKFYVVVKNRYLLFMLLQRPNSPASLLLSWIRSLVLCQILGIFVIFFHTSAELSICKMAKNYKKMKNIFSKN